MEVTIRGTVDQTTTRAASTSSRTQLMLGGLAPQPLVATALVAMNRQAPSLVRTALRRGLRGAAMAVFSSCQRVGPLAPDPAFNTRARRAVRPSVAPSAGCNTSARPASASTAK